jgi:hypothetical protein
LDAIAHAELLEDVGAVSFDGLLGDVQQIADLVVGVGFGDELEDLLLARREELAVGIRSPRRTIGWSSAIRMRVLSGVMSGSQGRGGR